MPQTGARRRWRRGEGVAALLLLASLLLVVAAPAIAQESPSSSPSSSPTTEPSPSAEPSPSPPPTSPSPTDPATSPSPPSGGGGGSGGSGWPGGGGSGGSGGGGGATFSLPPSGGGIGTGDPFPDAPGYVRQMPRGTRTRGNRDWRGWKPDPRWGTYNTAALDQLAAKRRTHGWSDVEIAEKLYAPFIVEGPAAWSDSWGAPRWDGYYHPHHGQDVLCPYGAPVLAVEDGTIAYGYDTLGGNAAYLERGDGSFWYYAHLSAYAPNLQTGMHVEKGQMIGRCGASGDASVPHVHFCFFTASHDAVDPMPSLVHWLHVAEERAGVARKERPGKDARALHEAEHASAPPAVSTGTVTGTAAPPTDARSLTPVGDISSRALGAAVGLVVLALGLTWAGRRSSRQGEVGSRR